MWKRIIKGIMSLPLLLSSGHFQTYTTNIVVAEPLRIITTTLPNGVVNRPYSVQLEAAGGTSAVSGLPVAVVGKSYSYQLTSPLCKSKRCTWKVTGLPAGLTCSGTGLVTGTATVAGNYSLTIGVK